MREANQRNLITMATSPSPPVLSVELGLRIGPAGLEVFDHDAKRRAGGHSSSASAYPVAASSMLHRSSRPADSAAAAITAALQGGLVFRRHRPQANPQIWCGDAVYCEAPWGACTRPSTGTANLAVVAFRLATRPHRDIPPYCDVTSRGSMVATLLDLAAHRTDDH
ncbi:hypothetical protein RJ55_02529 [Drechmeria coniospora]|nr:hypothetical protein RJ55_02529 [Drechmeria coniospora]